MSRLRLTNTEMVHIASPWLNPRDPAHQLILSKPALAGVLPALSDALRGLLDVLADKRVEQEAVLSRQAAELTQEYDNLVHVIFGALSALIRFEPDRELLQEISQCLLPSGLFHVKHGHRAKAGHVIVVAAQLTVEQTERLSRAKLGDTDLRALVERWIEVGRRLATVTSERARLWEPDSTQPPNTNELRLEWVRAVNGLIAMGRLSKLTEEEDYLLFNELRLAEHTADERAKRQKPAEPGEAAAAGETTGPNDSVACGETAGPDDSVTCGETAGPGEVAGPCDTAIAPSDTVGPGGTGGPGDR